MSFDAAAWIVRHPRLHFAAVIAAAIAVGWLGFVFAGYSGTLLCVPITFFVAAYGYLRFLRYLRFLGIHRRISGAPPLPPPEPPTEGAPRLAPLRPSSPLIMSARAKLPNDTNA